MITDVFNPTRFRYERKFFISELNRYEIESIIKHHPAIFSEIYNERFVNNIYFDTINLSNYVDNIIGISHRLKVRIRWYGELFGIIEKPVLELKIKKGFLGGKIRYPLNSFYFGSDHRLKAQEDIFTELDALSPLLREHLKSLRFTLLNRYSRKYFESADHKFRITIDFDMEFYKMDSANNIFYEKFVDRDNIVLELKYSDEDDEAARLITNQFPFRLTKNSKYVNGLEKLHIV